MQTRQQAQLKKLLADIAELDRRKTENRSEFYEPYLKQIMFHDAGGDYMFRLLMAGNQLGKTLAGAFEMTCHLTGEYPDWWTGRKFTKAITAWACGKTGLETRDVVQTMLCGEPGTEGCFGTGMIPKSAFVERPSLARGVADAFDTAQIRHKSGGVSILKFKSYDQGREKFQGKTLDLIWLDEEPPGDVYSECVTRVMAKKGMLYLTFTPLKGMSDVVKTYLDEDSPQRHVTVMTLDDVDHYTAEEKEKMVLEWPVHEREARRNGVPVLGEGAIFQIADEILLVDDFPIPGHWAMIAGIDFGISHPFAHVTLAWDRDADVVYLVNEFRAKDQTIVANATTIKDKGIMVPVAWPQDGHKRQDTGPDGLKSLASQYRKRGVNMLGTHAVDENGSNSVEASLQAMIERMMSGRWKVFRSCVQWMQEKRRYHRKDGLIVKVDDDLLDASRYAMMMLRKAKPASECYQARRLRNKPRFAQGMDYQII